LFVGNHHLPATCVLERLRQDLDADRCRILPYRDQPFGAPPARQQKPTSRRNSYSNNALFSRRLDLVLPPSGCHCDRVVEASHTASAWPASLFVLYVTTRTAQPAPASIAHTPSDSSHFPRRFTLTTVHCTNLQSKIEPHPSFHSKSACSRVTGRGSDRGCSAIRPTGNEPRLVRRL
jgi:hypothetical protein